MLNSLLAVLNSRQQLRKKLARRNGSPISVHVSEDVQSDGESAQGAYEMPIRSTRIDLSADSPLDVNDGQVSAPKG